MNISVVIPLLNEEESLPELCDWIARVMAANQFSYEVIMVDDGSTDDSWQVIAKIAAKNDCFKGIKFQRNYGKSAALNEAFRAAKGRCGNYNGCRYAGFARRNSCIVQYDD